MWLYLWLLLDWCGLHAEPPHSEIPAVVEQYFAEETSRALGVFWCESLHRPTAISKTNDFGVAQVNSDYWATIYKDIWHLKFEIEPNIRMAYEIWEWGEYKWGDGWLLWTCGRL